MPEPEPDPPSAFDPATGFAEELASEPADERVYRVALQLYEPTRVAAVAARADCASDTARRHLERLEDVGVLERTGDSPATYQRNDSYIEWRKRSRLEQFSTNDLLDKLKELTDREQVLRDRYDADAPEDVDALDHAEYATVEDVWLDLSEWETVRRRIRRFEHVRQQRVAESDSEVA